MDVDAMVSYRWNRVGCRTYFFTLTLRNHSSALLLRHIADLGNTFRTVRIAHPFDIAGLSFCRTTCTLCGPCQRATEQGLVPPSNIASDICVIASP
ncbi:protein of unknown function (plasmid) [Candidatus Methylocalor cossyra]|uniref:Uncharacterized protein n=1 Tax=Candidatus Methylocalor cossyra TaxID=3108543 RepID=A0ABP1CCI6_9GAMM